MAKKSITTVWQPHEEAFQVYQISLHKLLQIELWVMPVPIEDDQTDTLFLSSNSHTSELSLHTFLPLTACENILLKAQAGLEPATNYKIAVLRYLATGDYFENNQLKKALSLLLPEGKSERQFALNNECLLILHQLLNNQYQDTWLGYFVEAKFMELLTQLFLIHQDESKTLKEIHWLRKDEQEKIAAARTILLDNLESPLTIKSLSKKVGTNENYLKRGFKEMFGTTIYDYYQTERMKHARFLIDSEKLNVSEVAYRLGYSSVSHFSTAFKKYIGVNPCELIH